MSVKIYPPHPTPSKFLQLVQVYFNQKILWSKEDQELKGEALL